MRLQRQQKQTRNGKEESRDQGKEEEEDPTFFVLLMDPLEAYRAKVHGISFTMPCHSLRFW